MIGGGRYWEGCVFIPGGLRDRRPGCEERARENRRANAMQRAWGPFAAHHSTEIAAVVMPAPTEQSTSLSPGFKPSSISVMAMGMLALEVLPT